MINKHGTGVDRLWEAELRKRSKCDEKLSPFDGIRIRHVGGNPEPDEVGDWLFVENEENWEYRHRGILAEGVTAAIYNFARLKQTNFGILDCVRLKPE